MYLTYVDNYDYLYTNFMVLVVTLCIGLCPRVMCYWYNNVLPLDTRYVCSLSS